MEIKSKNFTEQQVKTETLINFPKGIPGFEEHTHFQLFQQQDSKIIFLLQSSTDKGVAFSVTQPEHFNISYNFSLTQEEETTLGLQSIDDLLILLILHQDERSEKSAKPIIKGSIKLPLLINAKTRIGIQKVLSSAEQSITLSEKNNEIEVSET
jgi:flagellar assembly factor FliW